MRKLSKKWAIIAIILAFTGIAYAITYTTYDYLWIKYDAVISGTTTLTGAVTTASTHTYSGNIQSGATGARLLDDYNLSSRATPLLTDPSYVFGFIDDFIEASINVLTDTMFTNPLNRTITPSTWVISMGATDSVRTYGPNVTTQIVDSVGGYISLSVGGADDDSTLLYGRREWVKLDTIGSKGTWFEIKLSIPDTTQFEFRVGLAERNISMSGYSVSGVWFQNTDGDATDKVIFMTDRAGSVDSVTAITNFAAATQYTFAFYANGSGTVTGYVDGTALTAISKFIPRTANLTPFILLKAGEAKAARVKAYVDYIKIVQMR